MARDPIEDLECILDEQSEAVNLPARAMGASDVTRGSHSLVAATRDKKEYGEDSSDRMALQVILARTDL